MGSKLEPMNFFPHPLILYTHTYTDMGTRIISISDDPYVRLSQLKLGAKMSFSDVILKFTPPFLGEILLIILSMLLPLTLRVASGSRDVSQIPGSG